MTFISYAQNHEDVMLYRALREVKEGFYIDVGAQDPVIDSVTKAFYERGWRGINIEPNEEYFRKLQDDRPHDVNLLTVVGREPGDISFYEVAHTGLSTTSAVYARRHAEAGYEVLLRNVPCTTLDRICTDCGVDIIHFLKIDVEGSERAVLEGFSFEAVRPWVVMVEATEPNSTREVFAEWEELLVRHRYQFVYFDGLNRFYIGREHTDLAGHFSCPPNPFDQYVSYHLWLARGFGWLAESWSKHKLPSAMRWLTLLIMCWPRRRAFETASLNVTGRSTTYETPPPSVTDSLESSYSSSKRFEARVPSVTDSLESSYSSSKRFEARLPSVTGKSLP
jgi:FkbM family methyltransferase